MNFLQGTLDLLILQALSGRSLHGYDVVEWIRNTTQDSLQIDDGALYTSLHGWNNAAGSPPSGACPRRGAALSTTASRPQGRSRCAPASGNGPGNPILELESGEPKREEDRNRVRCDDHLGCAWVTRRGTEVEDSQCRSERDNPRSLGQAMRCRILACAEI
jgi:hypothetical protein